jgi:hypothetical protein
MPLPWVSHHIAAIDVIANGFILFRPRGWNRKAGKNIVVLGGHDSEDCWVVSPAVTLIYVRIATIFGVSGEHRR